MKWAVALSLSILLGGPLASSKGTAGAKPAAEPVVNYDDPNLATDRDNISVAVNDCSTQSKKPLLFEQCLKSRGMLEAESIQQALLLVRNLNGGPQGIAPTAKSPSP